MTASVFFSNLQNEKFYSPLLKIRHLLAAAYASQHFFQPNSLVAIKIHFGELGNTAFLRPIYLRPVIDFLKTHETKPYLTDTNTLYIGMRTNSVDHLHNAAMNGFNLTTLGIPVIIADGLRGENTCRVKTDYPHTEQAKFAADILHADGMIVVSHFKGHEVSGFGGAIKNLSMGCASRQGKLDMHSRTRPYVNPDQCTACRRCQTACFSKAIDMLPKAVISNRCVGCARCLAICPEGAIKIDWNQTSAETQKMMVEYAATLANAMQKKILYLNILTDISPACDCYPGNDKPVVADIGFLSSDDPVAIDKASYDLVVQASGGEDPFQKVYPHLDPLIQFQHAQTIQFGELNYQLHTC